MIEIEQSPDPTIGSIVIGGTPNCILFIDASGTLAQDTSFTYDSVSNAFSISNTAFSSNANYDQISSAVTTSRTVSGTVSLSTNGQSVTLINSDSLTATSGKSPTASYDAIHVSAINNGRTIAGSSSITERIAGFYNFSLEPAGVNSITNSGTVTVNRYGTYSGVAITDTLNNASLTYNGNIYGGVFAAQTDITNTSSSSRTLNVYGVAGSADSQAGIAPTVCYGGYFVASNGSANYGAYLSGATAAAYCSGNVLFDANNTYTIANTTNRPSTIYGVNGNLTGDLDLASGSSIFWNSDVELYRNAADELRTPDSIRVDTSISVATAIDTDNGITVSKSVSTDTSHYGVQGSLTATGGNSSSTNVFTGLYGSVYLNAGASTFNNSYGVFGTSIIAPGQSGTVSNVYGLNFGVSNQSTSAAPVTTLTGARVAIVSATATVTGTVTTAIGFDVASSNNASSAQVITNWMGLRTNYAVPLGGTTTYRGIYNQSPTANTATTQRGIEVWTAAGTGVSAATTVEGLKINDVTSGGAWTTQYGIRIQDLDYASTNYALYFDGTSGLSRQGIWWNADTNLYRSAADTLETDDSLIVNVDMAVGNPAIVAGTRVYVARTFSSSLSGIMTGEQLNITTTGSITSSDGFSALRAQLNVNAAANTIDNATGIAGLATVASGQSGTVSTLYGLNFSANTSSTSGATITTLAGVRVASIGAAASTTGTVTTGHGFHATSTNSASSTLAITTYMSFRGEMVVPAGNVGTYRGLYLQTPTSNTCTTLRGVEIWTAAGTSMTGATTVEGLKINDVTSGNAWTTQYGIRIEDLDYASTNYALYFDGTSGLSRQGIWWNADTNLYRSAASVLATDDKMYIALECEIDGALNHDGSTVGFYGTTPVAQSATYTASNVSADRSYDANSTTVDELADVLGTLIADLKLTGIIG